jgi:two-component system cell cycle sensor histidine kinase/response regulator CckA
LAVGERKVEGLELPTAHRGEIPLGVLDVIMPQMDGRECLRRLRGLDPWVRVLISTGYTARGLAQELVAEGALGVVEKPFRIRDLAVAVLAALDES